jgi:hypothetical protein
MSGATACTGCGKALKPDPRRKGRRCRSCQAIFMARDPEIRARATASLCETLKDPKVLAKRGDPEYAERQRESGRRLGLSGTGIQRYGPGSEPRVRAGRNVSKTKRKGIPAAYYEHYRRMVHDDHIPAAEALQLVLELRDKDRKRQVKAREAAERLAAMNDEARARLGSAALGMAVARAAAKATPRAPSPRSRSKEQRA